MNKLAATPFPDSEKQLFRWLNQQRWFLEKQLGQQAFDTEAVHHCQAGKHPVWWLLIRTKSKQGTIYYQLPLAIISKRPKQTKHVIAKLNGESTGYLVDAWQEPWFIAWLFSQWQSSTPPEFLEIWCDPKQRWKKVSTASIHEVDEGQSNQAFTLGNHYFLKVQRRLVPGPSVDEEMCRELTQRGSNSTIPLLASMQWKTVPLSSPMAQLSPAIEHIDNGWNWLMQQKEMSANALQLLGQRTAELHQQLALPSDDDAFAPERVNRRQLKLRWTKRLKHTLTLLHEHTSPLAESFKKLAQQFLQQGWNLPKECTTLAHRVHGDYHLGQVLRTKNDWLIIDFEGEPLRPINERRAKDLPWRDVAGMVRSLEYLHAVLKKKRRRFPIEDARDAYLAGYSAIIDSESKEELLNWLPHYELEKALYEIEYELRSRPDWLEIPLSAAVKLLQQLAPGESPGVVRAK
jgi:maltose alpha-D-glucosyltransferase/alpha-amylase